MNTSREASLRPWLVFFFLGGFAWGASFLWIKIALNELDPFSLVTYRMAFGTLGTWLLLFALKLPVSYTRQRLLGSMFIGFLGLAIPITLLSWGETRIDSGLAGILNGTVPLWAFVIAHFALHDERITLHKALGLGAGFLGLVILMSRDLQPGSWSGSILGQLAVIGMAICYAISIVFTRRYLRGQHPVNTSAIAITTALASMLILTPIFESRIAVPRLPLTWLACAWLGVIGLSLALWAQYYLINHWGATRTTLVAYVMPVMAVILGIIFLNERLTWHLLVGGVLVIGGVGLVNATAISAWRRRGHS
jgi:drug/metabolite transporter (DMT)-like permease